MNEEIASPTVVTRKAREPGCCMWKPILPPKVNQEDATHLRNEAAGVPPAGQTSFTPRAETGES